MPSMAVGSPSVVIIAGASLQKVASKPPTALCVPPGRQISPAPQQRTKQLSSHGEVARTATPPPRSMPQQDSVKGGAMQRIAMPPSRTASPSLLTADSFLDAEMDAVVHKAVATQRKSAAVPARPSPLGAIRS